MHLTSFQINGRELKRRRQRCQPLLAALGDLPTESLAACAACASSEYFALTSTDRYGLPLRAAM